MVDVQPVSHEECMEIVRNRLQQTNGFKILGVTFSPIDKEQRGFLGEHYKVKITISDSIDGKEGDRSLHFFMKKAPHDDGSHADFVNAGNSYEKETFFFETLTPLLRKHLKGTQEEIATLLSVISPCYYIRPDLVVLEDLVVQGCFQLDKRTLLNYEQCLSVIHALARFHTASIVFEELESAARGSRCCLGDMFPILREDTFFDKHEEHAYGQAIATGVRSMAALVELSARYGRGSAHHELVQQRLEATMRSFFPQLRPSDSERNVVCHRDMWLNNVLFRSEQNVLSCRLVDMQLISYCPPANDLMMLLHVNTSREFRRQHEASLLSAYHSALRAQLGRHRLDADELLSWDGFRTSCNKARRVGVLLASFYCPISAYAKYAADYDIYDFIVRDRTEQTCQAYLTDTQYRQRLDDVIEEMVERYIL